MTDEYGFGFNSPWRIDPNAEICFFSEFHLAVLSIHYQLERRADSSIKRTCIATGWT